MAGAINTRQQLQELQLSGVTEEGRELGRGAYGVVVEVMVNGLRCAAKKLHPILLETSSAERAKITSRFVEECLQHSRLRHPNIVQLLGVYFPSPQANLPLMVMELMEMSLSSCLENKPNLSITTKNGILMGVARALLHLHNQNPPIIHRDLTANNVLLTSHYVAKISDLGVAKIVPDDRRSQLTCQLTKQPGTTAYMPPEASSSSYDTKLDVFSFGVLTLHVITNEWPLPDAEFVESPEKKGVYHRVSEADRRKKYIDEMGNEHLHKQLVCLCLNNDPDTRPSSQTILSNLESIASKIIPPKLPKKDEAGDSTSLLTQTQSVSSSKESTHNKTSATTDYDFVGEKMLVLDSTLQDSDWWLVKSHRTEKEGYIPSNYVESSYKSQEWFFGMMNKSDAEEKLHSPSLPKGAFLVREIAGQPSKFTLSVRDQDDSVKHHDINREQNMFYLNLTAKFASLEELVSYHKMKSHEPCCQLTISCPKKKTSKMMKSSSTDIHGDKWETERSGITLKQHLRKGCFGEFWQALWNGKIPVVVQSYTMASHDFLYMTQILKNLSHEKVIQLYAVCTQEKPFYIITESLKHGGLLEYLSKGNLKGQELKLAELVDIAAQVACGMHYLETKKYIHRSLGARNIQVGDRNIVKIDNFSFARIVSGEEYKERCIKQFPIRWCAPESLEHSCFSIKSDVWSFGVLLMELITYGSNPYKGLKNREVTTKVVSGYRMPRPDNCPEQLYETMLHCWKQDPQERPSFDSLNVSLEDNFPTDSVRQ